MDFFSLLRQGSWLNMKAPGLLVFFEGKPIILYYIILYYLILYYIILYDIVL